MNILTLNAGSSSLKYKLYSMPSEKILADGSLDNAGVAGIEKAAIEAIAHCKELGIDAIGHRVVHGASEFLEPIRITSHVLDVLHSLVELDPLHNPVEAKIIETALSLMPEIPSVASFDTAFHQTMPEIAWRYALPRDVCDRYGLRRYGFHGLSYEYVATELLRCLGRHADGTRLIICHLGNGSSICALRDGRSIDTSMGFTPLDGLVMGTRSGDLDPGLLLYLQSVGGMTIEQQEEMLNHRSGLLGISAISSDVRQLEEAVFEGNKRADLALEIFAYRACKYIGAYAAALEGVDAIAFTGGIGEHSSDVRSRICRRLGFMGVDLANNCDEKLAVSTSVRISPASSSVSVWVIPTEEDLQIARHTYILLSRS